MADYKFQVYEKIDGDKSNSLRLLDEHKDAPNSISEKQLEKGRVKEHEVITEKLLDKKRLNNDGVVTEKLLNDTKSKFGVKHRNEDAYNGNINKLEEQRISQNKKEEKYESASSTPKSLKWWDVKTNDGLKIASNKTAQVVENTPSVVDQEDLSGLKSEVDDDQEIFNYYNGSDNENEEDYNDRPIEYINDVHVVNEKEIAGESPRLVIDLFCDLSEIQSDSDFISKVALEKVLDIKPYLRGVLTENDFDVKFSNNVPNGKVVLDVTGDKYFDTGIIEDQEASNFQESEFKNVDVGGTPMTVGKVTFPANIVISKEEIKKQVVSFLNEKHPDLNISQESLDDSNVDNGEIKFAISGGNTVKKSLASLDFPIIIADSKKK